MCVRVDVAAFAWWYVRILNAAVGAHRSAPRLIDPRGASPAAPHDLEGGPTVCVLSVLTHVLHRNS